MALPFMKRVICLKVVSSEFPVDEGLVNEGNDEVLIPGGELISREKRLLQAPSSPACLDWDVLQVALTHLDHSPQSFKASVGRSGALSNRRPPSRSSRASSRASRKSSSAESISHLGDFAGLDEDLVVPKVVNVQVHLEEGGVVNNATAREEFLLPKRKKEGRKETRSVEDILLDLKASQRRYEKSTFYPNAKGTARKSLIFNSTPLLNFCDSISVSSEDILRNIKENYSKEVKSEGYHTPNRLDEHSCTSLNNSTPVSSKEQLDLLESSSETEVHISDRESIADSGVVNRRTVIKISEKSKSASNLEREEKGPSPEWKRDISTRCSLRTPKELTDQSLSVKPNFVEGINVSIKNRSEDVSECKKRDATSRMFVRQGDSENRPTRASAFNVRRTIEKRQIQQERRERKALREQIREHLRSLSQGRQRRESSCSSISSSCHSSSSVRSKSLSSLDQDQDDYRSESPLFKVQSSPTLDSEKEEVRTYLFGSNLSDTSPLRSSHLVSCIMSPCFSDNNKSENSKSSEAKFYFENPDSKSPQQSILNCVESLEGKKDCEKKITDHLSRNSQEKRASSFTKTNLENNLYNNSLNNINNRNNINSSNNHTVGKSANNLNYCNDKRVNNSNEIPDNKPTNTAEYQSHSTGNQAAVAFEDFSPVPPPRRRSLVSRSTGQLTVEKEEKPAWLRLAKERSSLRSPRTISDNLSDRSSSVVTSEPEWVTKARRKLESMNVCLTSVTDAVSVSTQITDSSAWSRGGLDALEDLKEEISCISEGLAEEAAVKIEKKLGIAERGNSTNMIEYPKKSREPSVERQRVSFDGSVAQNEKPRKLSQPLNPHKDEVRFGDLKHDWGGVQTKSSRVINGKHKETRFGEIHFNENITDDQHEGTVSNGCSSAHRNGKREAAGSPDSTGTINSEVKTNAKHEKLTFMHFGDTPQDIFTKGYSSVKSQSSSKFESIAGPDPTKMTAEELNQNVEEYDFPIPTGKEDATELINFLKESLNKQEAIPEFVSNDDPTPKPKSILKRKSPENSTIDVKKDVSKPQELQPISNTKEATSKIGKGFLVHPKVIDKPLYDRPNAVNKEKPSLESKRTPEIVQTPKNKRADISDKSLPKFKLTNTQSSVTNAASSFFNVKLRHVGTNKSVELEDYLGEPKKFVSLEEEASLKQSKNFPSLDCYVNMVSETRPVKDTPSVTNSKVLTTKANGMSCKIKALKTSFEESVQESSDNACHEHDQSNKAQSLASHISSEQNYNSFSLQTGTKSEIKTVSSVLNLAAGLIVHDPKGSPKSKKNIKDSDILRPTASKTTWMSCRSGQINQTDEDDAELSKTGGNIFPKYPNQTSPNSLTHKIFSQDVNVEAKSKSFSSTFHPYQKSSPVSSVQTFLNGSINNKEETYQNGPILCENNTDNKDTFSKTFVVFTKLPNDTSKPEKHGDSLAINKNNQFESDLRPRKEKSLRSDDLFGRRSLREPSRSINKSHKRIEPALAPPENASVPATTHKRLNNSPLIQTNQYNTKPEQKKKEIFHHKPREVHLEIVDSNRRSLPSSLEKRRERGSLFEWEAIQRQRIEDEEKNKLNKAISMKPVSSKIKDLVKIHSGFMSMFTKEKKGEYSGTVDAKEEIFFQKIPNHRSNVNVPIIDSYNKPMKSPYIIQNLINPPAPQVKTTSQIGKENNHSKTDRLPTSSLEREAYVFNQRNIYIDNDTIQRQRMREKKINSDNIKNLVSKRDKKLETPEGKPVQPEYKINHVKDSHFIVPSKNSSHHAKYQREETAKPPYKTKEWVNNVLNSLTNEKISQCTDKQAAEKEKDNFIGADKRNSFYRRSFHECILRTNDTTPKSPPKKEMCNDQTDVNKLKKATPKENYEQKSIERSGINLTTIIGGAPSVSSCISTPLTSPKASPKRTFSKPTTNFDFIDIPVAPTNEKENVCPVRVSVSRKYDNSRPFESANTFDNKDDIPNDSKEIHSHYNINSSATDILKKGRPDLTPRSFSKLMVEWEQRGMKERSLSPISHSEGNSFGDISLEYPKPSRFHRERSLSLRSNSSFRSTPERDSRPVSLSSILERDVSSPTSSTHRLSISEELNEITQNYRKQIANKRLIREESSSKDSTPLFDEMPSKRDNYRVSKSSSLSKNDDTIHYTSPTSRASHRSKRLSRPAKEPPPNIRPPPRTIKLPTKEIQVSLSDKLVVDKHRTKSPEKDLKPRPKRLDLRPSVYAKNTCKESIKTRVSSKQVKRKSSLKRSQSGDSSSLASFKRDRKNDLKRRGGNEEVSAKSERRRKDSEPTSERYESIRRKPGGAWTKTSVRRVKLGAEPLDKILSTKEREKHSRSKDFKQDASLDLERWAAGATVQGKLVKKEGHKYSHHVEEEIQGEKKSSKAISRRVVRRGSRRLSTGGELVSETKEMAYAGSPPSNRKEAVGDRSLMVLSGRPKPHDSRKIKTSTDGERYVTQSFLTDAGVKKFTTEGIDNKNTKSIEIIGGKGWGGEREVQGRHGERVIMEQSVGASGFPSTVVKKATTQSRVIVTKTKKVKKII